MGEGEGTGTCVGTQKVKQSRHEEGFLFLQTKSTLTPGPARPGHVTGPGGYQEPHRTLPDL